MFKILIKTLKVALLAAIAVNVSSCSRLAKNPAEPVELQSGGEGTDFTATRSEISRAPAITAKKFKKDTIMLLIKADSQLNRFERNSHTLFLCLYQLKDPNGFNQLVQDKDGLPKLMECNRFDATVANAKQFVVQPGQEFSDVCDKAEGARYIGIATGYYGMGKVKITGLSPLLSTKEGSGGSVVRIDLGPYQISSIEVK
jgi:type VI secretion system VasD/TssJ family lipoprotein